MSVLYTDTQACYFFKDTYKDVRSMSKSSFAWDKSNALHNQNMFTFC